MVGELAVPKQLRDHGQRTRSQRLVDEGLLPVQGFNGRATRQRVSATTEEVLEWIGDGLCSRVLSFPERNGPIIWPRFALSASLFPAASSVGLIGSGLPVS